MIEVALFFQTLVFVAVLVAFVLSPSSSLFHPLSYYLLFHFLVFVLRPIMVHFMGFELAFAYMGYFPDETAFMETLALSTVGMLVFALVCWLAGRVPVQFSEAGLPPLTPAQKTGFALTLLTLGPFALYAGLFASQGASFDGTGDILMTHDIATGTAVFVNTTGYLVDAHTALGTLAVLFLWRFRFSIWSWIPLVLFILYRAFLGWARFAIITTLLTLALVFLYRTRQRWIRVGFLVAALPIFVLFHNLGVDRNLVRDFVEGESSAEVFRYADAVDGVQQFDTLDFANFEYLSFIKAVVPEQTATYTYFTQYLQLFTEPIPRIIWKEKPVGMPVRLLNLNDHGNFWGLTPSLVGDGWMSWGWFGVIVTMGAVGFILGWMHRWFWRNQHSQTVIMLYCMFIPLSILWFRDGGISITKFVLWAWLPILVWIGFTRMVEIMESRLAPAPPRLPPAAQGGQGRSPRRMWQRPRP